MRILHTFPDYIKKVVTDSRRITPSQIASGDTAFVALKTGVGDGHRYVESLYRQGLRTFVVSAAEQFESLDEATFIVAGDDTLSVLIDEAGRRLARSGARQIVVTGSYGKTTAKESIAAALVKNGVNAVRSPRTWNSAMGAALGLFDNTSAPADVIVTEIGIDAPGQAERIAPMLQPAVGVITTIGAEHDEAFENHRAKVMEKLALVRNADKIVYMRGDETLEQCVAKSGHPNAVGVSNLVELVAEVTGFASPLHGVSTKIEVRSAPENCVLFIDSFTNDLASLPLSLDMASERQTGRKLTVFLGDFDGDRNQAADIVAERGGDVFFFDRADSKFTDSLNREDFADRLIVLKGATPELISFFDEARHDTTLEVDVDALVHNFNAYRRLLPPGTGIVAMVKADAYGLGALEVAKTLQSRGAAYLAVAVVDEAVALRREGIKMPIVVLNPVTNRFDAIVAYDLEPAVFSLEQLKKIESALKPFAKKPVPIHIKLDTGMHRVGFNETELDMLADLLKDSRTVTPVSLFSHLATADCPDLGDYTAAQVRKFGQMSERLESRLGRSLRKHLLNTAGIETMSRSVKANEMVRLGIGLYGVSPLADSKLKLRPVARLVSTIVALREYDEGTFIGYGCRGKTVRKTFVATLPLGYADGIDRRLGCGKVSFYIGDVPCPTIGNICMDLLMIDVTDALPAGLEVGVGTPVEIIGLHNTVENVAQLLGTIPYEILTSVSPRVRRSYHFR